MIKKLIKAYYKLLDERLENGTVVVLIIAMFIVMAGSLNQQSPLLSYSKNNLLEISTNSGDIIQIDGKKYKIIIDEVR